MNFWEQKIRHKESELHTNLKTKSGKKLPDLIGYNSEDLQLSDYMVWAYNTHNDPILRQSYFHVKNEGTRGGMEGARDGAIDKGKGKKKGVLDVESVYLGNMLWFEFKPSWGKFSDEQLTFISSLIGWKKDVFIIKENQFDFFKYIFENILMRGIALGGGVWTSIEQVKQAHR